MAGSITIAQIITCSLAAFAFSFLEFKGRNVLFMIVLATMMVPGEATIVSNYLTVGNLGMLDTYPVLIVPYLTSAMEFSCSVSFICPSLFLCMNQRSWTDAAI